ncbi:lysozyme inhibitor LprI family protein [Breoghania sp. L-A4]|uniref:lysozyme inhibitor LprI family protein n=1 Tax=Breoghania sp. L-A4 TaxID=2304600 RepID=UPI000E35D093|nr:lysozyme inhibitor LprI family protein [Breoghania sp. L-A4]AXS40906.1 DUF1311 domain-containing protein [Breoghania sp. L-A4]
MRSILLCAVVALAAASGARAQDNFLETTAADRSNLQSCIEAAHDMNALVDQCIGAAADPCMDHPDNQHTMGMSACAVREQRFWDERLNAAYSELRRVLGEPVRTELRDVQRLWIKWRDTSCAFTIAYYDGGTAYKPAMALCGMRATARRAIDLQEILDLLKSR